MEGSISGNDFKDFINGFVRDHNKKNSGTVFPRSCGADPSCVETTGCTLSKGNLDFQLSGPSQVVDFDEQKFEEDTVTITNTSKNKLYYQVLLVDNPKFELTPIPWTGEVKKACASDVFYSLSSHSSLF